MTRFLLGLLVVFQTTMLFGQESETLTLPKLMSKFSEMTSITRNVQTTEKLSKSDLNKILIGSISIEGNKTISTDLIQNRLSIRTGDRVNAILLRRNIKNIHDLGVFADTSYALSEPHSDGSQDIVILVEENPRIGAIQFEGNTLYDSDALKALLLSKEGDLLNLSELRKDTTKLETTYLDEGYTKMSVYSVSPPRTDGAPLIFYMSEGLIEEIILTGNALTKDHVILREMNTRPGDLFNNTLFSEDVRRVFNLNYFTNIEPELLPGKLPHSHILQLNIEEKPTNAQISFGGGYSPTSGFSVFSDLFWDNLMGTGQTIQLRGQFGRANTYQFKYHNPWMWDDRKSFTFKYWNLNGEVESLNPLGTNVSFQDQRSQGIETTFGIPYTYDFRTSHTLKHENVLLTESDIDYRVSSYKLGLSYDTRDFWANPLSGQYHTFFYEQGIGFYENSLVFSKFDVELRRFFQTFENQTFATRLALGFITSDELEEDELYSREIYRLGGSSTVRGWDDFDPFSSGNKMVLMSAEYRYHFNQVFQGILFIDTGYASYITVGDLSRYRVGKGIGVRIQSPLGPLRLDYAINDDGDSYIHFNIGHTF